MALTMKKMCEEMEIEYMPVFNPAKISSAYNVFTCLKEINEENSFGLEGLDVWCAEDEFSLTICMTDYSIVIDGKDMELLKADFSMANKMNLKKTPNDMIQLEVMFDLH